MEAVSKVLKVPLSPTSGLEVTSLAVATRVKEVEHRRRHRPSDCLNRGENLSPSVPRTCQVVVSGERRVARPDGPHVIVEVV